MIILYYNSQTYQNDVPQLKLSCSITIDNENSLFKNRLNQRLFHLGQQFSHINIDKLLQIQSSSTQTFTYYCSSHCGGWGDRLRGLTSAYILAVLLKRRFIIDMQYPHDLSKFLLPNLIDWKPISSLKQQKNYLQLDLIHSAYESELAQNVVGGNLTKYWLKYDNIYFTTNADFISIILKNPVFKFIISEINIQSKESTQKDLFPFLFELLFKPSSIVMNIVNQLFLKSSLHPNKSMVCMHIRVGQNPTLENDAKVPFRQTIVRDMLNFIDKNSSYSNSSIFISSDSYDIQQRIYEHYGTNRVLSISGPIIHIDRFNTKLKSNETLYHGFLKVIADFYVLGECNTLLRARSGFSEWAGRRRLNEYSNLYIYCRGIHQVTGPQWHRPYQQC